MKDKYSKKPFTEKEYETFINILAIIFTVSYSLVIVSCTSILIGFFASGLISNISCVIGLIGCIGTHLTGGVIPAIYLRITSGE